jgi:UDP-N-acetylmuramate--alanine ligase
MGEATAAAAPIDLSGSSLSIHIVGIGGAGMSAIATVLAGMGHRVTGSDLKGSSFLDRLRAVGVDVRIGHDAAHVGDVDVVAVSTAIPATNPEVVAARTRGIRLARRAEILAAIVATRNAIAVGGTHGKTTTSSMLSLVLMEAGMHPSFIVGGELNEIGTGAVWDPRGELLVVEADESDGTFIELPAQAVIVTNVEPDHIEHYGSFAALRAAFERFVEQAAGPRIVCVDDPLAATLAAGQRTVGYGTSAAADYRMTDIVTGHGRVTFALDTPSGERWSVVLPVPGLHNARNAAGAMAMALELGASGDAAVRALGRYAGVARRFETRGTAAGVTFVDEYSHLPSEVAAAIEAAREGEWRRVVCVFQPHRFSRTATLWQDFADAFVGADLLAVTDVYSAGEAPRPGITGKLIVNAVLDEHPMQRVAWLPHRADLVSYLQAELRAGDLCLTMGAGDLTTLPDVLLEGLTEKAG